MKQLISLALVLLFSISSYTQNLSIDQKVDSLLSLMTLDEKIGQMTQAERGALENTNDISYYKLGSLLSGGGSSPTTNSVNEWAKMYDQYQNIAIQTRLSIPIIYGVDAVHGHNNVYGTVIFPHNIGLGCTWNPDLVKKLNQITATEVAATGIDWTFSPCIAVPQDERWGRTYEGFGETAEIQKIMAYASIDGLQGDDLNTPNTILACAKHFVGDGGTTNGNDQGNTEINETVLRELHMPGYIDAINSKVGSIMASYNSWNGLKMHGNGYLLTDVLKNELGFEGFVVSDWKGVDQINEDYREAVKRAINAGIDMVMVPDRYIYFISILKDLVEKNEVSQARIDDAVKRILKQKFLLNLFKKPLTDNSLASSVGSTAHRAIAQQAVRESLVLLSAKNEILPLSKDGKKILVAGKLANNIGGQCGGWTISWQGANGATTVGTSILSGIRNTVGTSEIIFSESGTTLVNIDAAIVVIGENPYAEGAGDRVSLNIENEEINLVKGLKEKGIPVVVVLISGRPMIISELLPYTDAFIAAWLPGTEGKGIAEILFGNYLPKGKLTHSWPKTMRQIPINFGDPQYDPLFAYKHGLQSFPTVSANSKLEPYAALLEQTGTSILLSLNDQVSSLNYELNDFQIKVDGVVVPNAIKEVKLASYDKSILEIVLNNAISSETVTISINYLGNSILASSKSLIEFNNLFVYNAFKSFEGAKIVPGKIEAEDYIDMFGVQTEVCTDIGGGLNVGWINAGDWMKYNIEVETSGNYSLTSRIAGYNTSTLLFTFNESLNAQIDIASTDGWQNWQDFSTTIYLEKGYYEMKVLSNSEAFNINYFNFDLLTGLTEKVPLISDFELFPNPSNANLNLRFSSLNGGKASINLFDMKGRKVQEIFEGNMQFGLNTFSIVLNQSLDAGIYFIEIKDEKTRYFVKLIKN